MANIATQMLIARCEKLLKTAELIHKAEARLEYRRAELNLYQSEPRNWRFMFMDGNILQHRVDISEMACARLKANFNNQIKNLNK